MRENNVANDFNVRLTNLREFRRTLSKYAPEVKKALDKTNRETAQPLLAQAKKLFPDFTMGSDSTNSNWGRWISKKDGRNLSYDPSTAQKGIKIKQYGRAKGSPWSGMLQLRNESAAGAIFEVAGRQNPSGSTPQGGKFIDNLNKWFYVKTNGLTRGIWLAVVRYPASKFSEQIMKNYEEVEQETQKYLDGLPNVDRIT